MAEAVFLLGPVQRSVPRVEPLELRAPELISSRRPDSCQGFAVPCRLAVGGRDASAERRCFPGSRLLPESHYTPRQLQVSAVTLDG
jgi:hypothetical protein